MGGISVLYVLDLFGTFAFAVSGALVGVRKQMDLYGLTVLGVVTAVGGGTIRDALLGRIPPFVFVDWTYLAVAFAAVLLVFFFHRHVERNFRLLLIMDAIGLGVFTVIGTGIALAADMNVLGAVIMGVLTGTAGGMIRDILAGQVPLVLTKEVYASACIVGGALFYGLSHTGIPESAGAAVSMIVVIALRLVAISRGWNLPRPGDKTIKNGVQK